MKNPFYNDFLPQERMQQSRIIPPMPKTPARIGTQEFEGIISAPLREDMFAMLGLKRTSIYFWNPFYSGVVETT